MDTDKLSHMYASIVNGGNKEDCPYVTDDESSKAWDEIWKQCDDIGKRGHGFQMLNDTAEATLPE
jgi:hypothetical protein